MRIALCILGLIGLIFVGAVNDTDVTSPTPAKAGKKKALKGKKGAKKAPKAAAVQNETEPTDRFLVTGAPMAALPVLPPLAYCPFNNCAACTKKPGCGWIRGQCLPCAGQWCEPWTQFCGGCQRDSQCGPNARCDNGQCLGNEGDRNCDWLRDCTSCLARPNCLWDPNTLTGSCKPKEQCDFTYQMRAMSLVPGASRPPASACVASLDRCSQRNFDGTPLTANADRGIGCTNHGQCAPGQYCFSCSKCTSNCALCRIGGRTPTSGMCGPAERCPIDNDSISQTCPPPLLPPVVPDPCGSYAKCIPCTAAPGCIWSGNRCRHSQIPCSGVGCANTPAQCPRMPIAPNCAFNNCQSCTAVPGCVWSGSICYFAPVPCTNIGCATMPSQCGGCSNDAQCGPGRRCSSGSCVDSAGDRSCDWYVDCWGCLTNPNCLWDPNSNTHCKPKEQCDFTYRGLALPGAAAPPPATACVKTVDRCTQTNFEGAILNQNENRGAGCTNHGQCKRPFEYCFSCSKCRGNCGVCQQPGGAPMSGGCGPVERCRVDMDSIDGLCPNF